MKSVEVENLAVSFNGKEILKRISFSLNSGDTALQLISLAIYGVDGKKTFFNDKLQLLLKS